MATPPKENVRQVLAIYSPASGDFVDLEEPSGAACMFGGLWPCGLDAGAPPLPVSSGPVHPWGCSAPLVEGEVVVPVPSGAVCAFTTLVTNNPFKRTVRIVNFIVFRHAIIKATHSLLVD
jgi:hypothetical protein